MFNLFAMLSYMLICCITPGPNNILCMSNGTKYGFRKSMPFCWGVGAGTTIILLLSIAGNVFLSKYIPWIVNVLTYVGAIYILFLAWVIWRDKPKKEKKRRMNLDTTSFTAAIILQAVNPKGLMYCITLISSFVFPYYQSAPVLFGVIVANFVIAVGSLFCWVVFGSVFKKVFEDHRKLLNAIMALLLVYCAVSLFL